MKKQLKTLGMVMVIGTSILFATGCSSTETTEDTSTEVTENNMDKEREIVKELLITSEEVYNKINKQMSSVNSDDFKTIKETDELSEEAKKISDDIDEYLDKGVWAEDTIEYKALLEMRNAHSIMYDSLQKIVVYLDEGGNYSDYKEFAELIKTSQKHFDTYVKEYKEKLGITDSDKETQNEKEEKETKKETKTAVCYDCAKTFPVDQMTFNGRSYHCGCSNEYCEECKKEIPYGEEVTVGDNCYLCKSCYKNYESEKTYQCEYCATKIKENQGYKLDGQLLCEGCYNRIMHNRQEESSSDTWTCPNCGRTNQGEVLCDCEME